MGGILRMSPVVMRGLSSGPGEVDSLESQSHSFQDWAYRVDQSVCGFDMHVHDMQSVWLTSFVTWEAIRWKAPR